MEFKVTCMLDKLGAQDMMLFPVVSLGDKIE